MKIFDNRHHCIIKKCFGNIHYYYTYIFKTDKNIKILFLLYIEKKA